MFLLVLCFGFFWGGVVCLGCCFFYFRHLCIYKRVGFFTCRLVLSLIQCKSDHIGLSYFSVSCSIVYAWIVWSCVLGYMIGSIYINMRHYSIFCTTQHHHNIRLFIHCLWYDSASLSQVAQTMLKHTVADNLIYTHISK